MERKRFELPLIIFAIAALLLVMVFDLPVEGMMAGFVVLAISIYRRSVSKILIPTAASAISIVVGLGTFIMMLMASLEQGAPASDYWLINVIFG
ncbi:MAG: hypothetical protein IJ779_10955 [Ruminococcus sp.]|nr:hypothetical protein [Ruminococcus sp.]